MCIVNNIKYMCVCRLLVCVRVHVCVTSNGCMHLEKLSAEVRKSFFGFLSSPYTIKIVSVLISIA